jgi:hypothetical protein
MMLSRQAISRNSGVNGRAGDAWVSVPTLTFRGKMMSRSTLLMVVWKIFQGGRFSDSLANVELLSVQFPE